MIDLETITKYITLRVPHPPIKMSLTPVERAELKKKAIELITKKSMFIQKLNRCVKGTIAVLFTNILLYR